MVPKPLARHERGNALVMTIFALFALVSIATLVVNQILIYEVQAKLQNAADALHARWTPPNQPTRD